VIHAYALEPQLVATWGRGAEYRFIYGNFGLGTPRALLELPKFNKWKRAVYDAASGLGLSELELKRIDELLALFGEHRSRRADSVYDGVLSWLENAEREYDRKPFKAILATANPRAHRGVLVGSQLDPGEARWACSTGATPARTPEALAAALSTMLVHCRVLHLVDPYFGPENARHRKVLVALMNVLSDHQIVPEVVRVHCAVKPALAFFDAEAKKMASWLPATITVEFVRWQQKLGGDRLHNRYVLTDLGGVSLGIGLDAGGVGETDDLLLLPRAQYAHRWAQYVVNDGTFEQVDVPASVRGTRRPPAPRRGR
jgi:hypothetical protein